MGIADRKEKEKEIRRNDIINAAEKVFFLKGFYAATMDDVASEAEFSKRTIYIYFNSKEQIYFEIMVRGYKILIEMVEEGTQTIEGENPLDVIRKIGKILYIFHREYPDYFKAIMEYENGELDFVKGVPDKAKEECYMLGEQIFGLLTAVLKDGIEKGVIRSELDITSTAILLWSSTVGIFNTLCKKRNYIIHYHNKNPEELLTESFDLLIRSIKTSER